MNCFDVYVQCLLSEAITQNGIKKALDFYNSFNSLDDQTKYEKSLDVVCDLSVLDAPTLDIHTTFDQIKLLPYITVYHGGRLNHLHSITRSMHVGSLQQSQDRLMVMNDEIGLTDFRFIHKLTLKLGKIFPKCIGDEEQYNEPVGYDTIVYSNTEEGYSIKHKKDDSSHLPNLSIMVKNPNKSIIMR